MQEEIGDRKSALVLGMVLLQQGRFCFRFGLMEKASEALERSLVIFRDLHAQREAAYALYYMGGIVRARGGEARPLLQEALAIARGIGDQRGVALCLWGLGWSATYQGEQGAAKQLFQESLALARELGDQGRIVQCLHSLGYVTWVLGEHEEAEELHQESLALCTDVNDRTEVAYALGESARDAAGLEKFGKARQRYQESLALHEEVGNLRGLVVVLGDLGEIANVLGEYSGAIQPALECLAIARRIEEHPSTAWALRILGDAACGLGDLPRARRYQHQALEVLTKTQQITYYAPLSLVGIAALLAAEGEKERALELLALVLHHPISWQWVKDRAAPLVAQLEAELSPDTVAAAWASGRARDLDATVPELPDELGGSGSDLLDEPAGLS